MEKSLDELLEEAEKGIAEIKKRRKIRVMSILIRTIGYLIVSYFSSWHMALGILLIEWSISIEKDLPKN